MLTQTKWIITKTNHTGSLILFCFCGLINRIKKIKKKHSNKLWEEEVVSDCCRRVWKYTNKDGRMWQIKDKFGGGEAAANDYFIIH